MKSQKSYTFAAEIIFGAGCNSLPVVKVHDSRLKSGLMLRNSATDGIVRMEEEEIQLAIDDLQLTIEKAVCYCYFLWISMNAPKFTSEFFYFK